MTVLSCGLFKVHRRLLPNGQSAWTVKLTTHLYLEPRLRMRGLDLYVCCMSPWRSA